MNNRADYRSIFFAGFVQETIQEEKCKKTG
jgi:hypothetical protein